jgi:glycosyltransferase involved in cell wall biosynthesis
MVACRFPAVRYLARENSGVSAARNYGIAHARGTWIALLDSDDEWRSSKLAQQLEALSAAPHYRICHTDEIWIRRGRRVNPHKKHAKAGGDIFERCLPLCAMSPSAVLIARELLDEVGLFDEALPACEDYDLWLRICATNPVLFVPEPLVVKYGGHDDQLSTRYWGMDRFRIQALENLLRCAPLAERQRRAALETLLGKIEVYLNGAAKRGKDDEVTHYQQKRQHWTRELADLTQR